MKTTRHLALGVGFLLFAAAAASAQQPSARTTLSDDRWAPWLGCWRVAEENVQDAATLAAESSGRLTGSAARGSTRVCVTPSENGGATMTTLVNDRSMLAETIVADGEPRPLTENGCKGWQQAEWSSLGPRVFARAEISCQGQAPRTISGMGVVVSGPVWLDIQVIESEGRKSVRLRRYRRAADQEQAAAPAPRVLMPLGGKLSLAEIKEAATKVAPEVLQAAVLELGGGGYDLDGRRLLELDDAGVPDSVIDLMVAMSFPERFVVERAASGGGSLGPMWDPTAWYGAMWPFYGMWPYYDLAFAPYAGFYPYDYSSYYSPFGYRNWGYYDPFYRPGVIIINPDDTSDDIQPSGNGRIVNGRGYTRIRRVEPEPARVSDSGSGGTSSTSRAGSNSGGRSGVSSEGYSGGGNRGSGGGGRVAVPRRPPGGH